MVLLKAVLKVFHGIVKGIAWYCLVTGVTQFTADSKRQVRFRWSTFMPLSTYQDTKIPCKGNTGGGNKNEKEKENLFNLSILQNVRKTLPPVE